jgi:hypothetical protein
MSSSSLMNNMQQYPEYYMCTRKEAIDRYNCYELHPLEYCYSSFSSTATTKEITSTSSNNSNSRRFRPTYDSRYVIKKYRRSAAGGGTTSTETTSSSTSSLPSTTTTRTIDQLAYTVDYLLEYIFVNQYPPPYTQYQDPNNMSDNVADDTCLRHHPPPPTTALFLSPLTLCNVVSFIDDRLRAVQKELVTLIGTDSSSSSNSSNSISGSSSRKVHKERQKMAKLRRAVRHMQVKMIRYGIVSTYLLSEVTATTRTSSEQKQQQQKSQQNNTSKTSSSSSYEYTFSIRALRTALTTYMSLCTYIHDDYSSNSSDDDDDINNGVVYYQRELQECMEVTSYIALLHLSGVIYNTEILGSGVGAVSSKTTTTTTTTDVSSPLLSLMDDGGSGYNALLLQLQQQQQQQQQHHPRLKWTLELACAAQEGNYQRYLYLLKSGPALVHAPAAAEEEAVVDQARFLILARCCMSNSINLIRLGQLRRYNFAYRKEEKVSLFDIARLLHFTTNNRGDKDYDEDEDYVIHCAIDFCRYSGLPIVDADIDVNDINKQETTTTKKSNMNCHVVMKSVPISVKGDNAIRMMCRPGRMNDSFVFGTRLVDYKQQQQHWDDCSHGKEGVELLSNEVVVLNLGERTDNAIDQTTAAAAAAGCCYARKDEDGVLIPPSNVLRSLIS